VVDHGRGKTSPVGDQPLRQVLDRGQPAGHAGYSYKKLVGLTRGVVRQASDAVQRWSKGRLKVVGKFLRVQAQIGQLRHFLPLVEKVITQTKERVWGGNCHVEGKVLSLFEPHTELIRKGKAHKPNEFARLVRIDEVENGIVSGYQVLEGNAADTNSWLPAIQHHQARFWGRSEDGHRGPRIFLGQERARGGGFGSRESGPAGDRAFVAEPRRAAETTLV